MLKRLLASISLSALTLLIGCQSDPTGFQENLFQQVSTENNSPSLTPYTLKGWKTHLDDVKTSGDLQKGCQPFYKLAKGKTVGSVMLFHGFTACPQQYEEIAGLLSNNGYNVFVPLLPGHGKTPIRVQGKFTDESTKLPDVKSTDIYTNFSRTMGGLLKDEPGTKVAGGLSVGGVIAAKAILENPDVYKRGFLMAPFFNAAGSVSLLLPALGGLVPNKEHGWGEGCEKERSLGRAGYCNFKITHVAAVRKFGLDTLKKINNIKIPIQIIGVEKDPAASNSAIAEANRSLANGQGCFLAKGANHSMLSRHDNVDTNMFWLSSLTQQISRFIDTGKNFDIVGESEYGMGLCRSR